MKSDGLILVNALFRPVFADAESIKILAYPNAVANPQAMGGLLSQKIIACIDPETLALEGSVVAPLQSGKRQYLCKAFMLENHWDPLIPEARIALLLERGLADSPVRARRRLHAGMCDDPFSFAPDPKYYCFNRAHVDGLAALRDMVLQGMGMAALVAPAGVGKTMLLHYMERVLKRECDFAHFSGAFPRRGALLKSVMASFGLDAGSGDESGNTRAFVQWLTEKTLSGRRIVLFCDNAQDMDVQTLEHLCSFSEFELGRQKLLQIIFAGRQALIEKLSGPRVEATGGRIHLFCRLSPMDEGEVRRYVLHRLRLSGCTRQLFTPEALTLIALYSRGIALNVNMLCRHCLSLAASVNLQMVDERLVDDSAYDLVLRSQPFSLWDDSGPLRDRRRKRERRTLRLVKK